MSLVQKKRRKHNKVFMYGIMLLAFVVIMAVQVMTNWATQRVAEADLARLNLVDVRIGSSAHGHVFVGASVPFGMVQLGPTSIPVSWDWCSGYHASDSTVIGFSHTHLSGTGIGDLFDVTVMPVVGEVKYARGNAADPESGLWSMADRSSEIAVPGYYSVPLKRYGIQAEMTATCRVGMHRYTFPKSEEAAIVFDLQNGGCWDQTTACKINKVSDTRITGYRYSNGWAKHQEVYFVAEFSKPMSSFTLAGANDMYARIGFSTGESEQLLVKVAISPVSIEGAERNLAAELPGWDFDATRDAASRIWAKELSRVRIKTCDERVNRIFYTALYHTMLEPVTYCDVDGQYKTVAEPLNPRNGAPDGWYTGKAEGFTPYSVLSLWDTYRAEMPLLSIIQPERYADMVNCMIDICEHQGRLPVWHLWGNETDCMIGNPGIIVVADAVVKKTPGVDGYRAMRAMLTTAADTARGGGLRRQYGYIPSDKMDESIAYDMEYAIADAAISNAAATLTPDLIVEGRQCRHIADSFAVRSRSYRNYFCPETHFIRGRMADGSWRTPFDPFSSNHRADDYCEGNAWQYTWLVPHDIEGYAESCFGSKEALIEKFDSLFTISSQITGEETSPDITGLIGQYAHGNEPSHHTLYLYTILGQPEKTARLVDEVLRTMYTTEADGIIGNEDAGQMSAWYVLSALGFYEVEPASGRYWLGRPIVDKAEITVAGGMFEITVNNNSPENCIIESATLNGKPLETRYIMHSDIARGGHLVINMKAE